MQVLQCAEQQSRNHNSPSPPRSWTKPDVAEMSGQLSLAAERLLVTDRPACIGTPVLQHTLPFQALCCVVRWEEGNLGHRHLYSAVPKEGGAFHLTNVRKQRPHNHST